MVIARFSFRLAACGLLLAAGLSGVAAAPAAPRPLTYADAANFYEVLNPTLSRDGRWLAVLEQPQEGDGTVVVRDLDSTRTWRAPAGTTPPTAFPRASSPNEKPPALARPAFTFTGDSRFVVIHAQPTRAEQAAARIAPAKPAPARSLVVLDLATGRTETVARVASYQVSGRTGAVLTCLLTPPPAAGAEKSAATGHRLLVRDLTTGRKREIAGVSDYTLARDGRALVVVASGKIQTTTLRVIDPAADTAAVTLYSGPAKLSRLTWDPAQGQLACIAEETAGRGPLSRRVLLWSRGSNRVRTLVDAATPGVPAGLIVSDKAALTFTPDGRKLLLGVAPAPTAKPALPADPEDRVSADLWSWQDDLIQPRQEVRAAQDRDRSCRAVVDLANGAYTQIGTPEMPDVIISDDATRALAIDYRPYYRERDYDATYGDVHVVDLATGRHRRVLEKLRGGTGDEGEVALQLSPDGRHASYYTDKNWHLLDLATGRTQPLTTTLPAAFYNELHDEPSPPPAWGFGGWADDSQSLLLYDRYDLWQVFTDGRPAQNLTHGYGRAHGLVLRRQDFAAREEENPARGVDLAAALDFRGEDEHTRATGYFRFTPGRAEPERRLWRDCNYTYVGRALAADRLMFTASRFDEFPDVWVTGPDLAAPRRVTAGGDQLAPFAWGRAELLDYRSPAGVPLQAALYLPPDFDPAKKYPLIVYTYERLSLIVHRFFPPIAGSNISFPVYASNGYLVMLADIAYTRGRPGADAVACVHAALDAAIARGGVDERAVGYQGSSWGGYTAAYLLTHSDRFAALAGGAIVSNMTSAYGGIRTYSGQPRLFQYEQSQSRLGRSLADAPGLYLENSPLFTAAAARAPFLILHNDRDGAVPFAQAVEFYLALRRLDKPVWLFNYRDEGHGLDRPANRRDWSRRLWQFFDHYLRGAPAPDWLEHGIPYLQRDEEKVRFNAAPTP